MSAKADRLSALGGVIGPAGFAGAWLIGSLTTDGYSMVNDAISRLAAVGADTRVLMSMGFVTFTVGVLAFAKALRSAVPGAAWISATATAIATLGVAVFPLDHSSTVDAVHGVAATTGYITLAATSLLAAPQLRELGRPRAAAVSRVAGLSTAFCLGATIFGPTHGLFQRLGVSIGDLWIIVASFELLRTSTGVDQSEQ